MSIIIYCNQSFVSFSTINRLDKIRYFARRLTCTQKLEEHLLIIIALVTRDSTIANKMLRQQVCHVTRLN